MSDDINNLDTNDEGLKGIFGARFHDATQEEVPPRKNLTKVSQDAKWEPAKPDPNWMDSMKSCAKSVLLFGGLSFLIFYWQQAGLMDSSVAVPTMCICTALAGVGVGRNIR